MIRPRLHSAIESGFLYTPPTANGAGWLFTRSACVGGDIGSLAGSITCCTDARVVLKPELVRYIERITDAAEEAE